MRIDNELLRNHPERSRIESVVTAVLAAVQAEWDAWIHCSLVKGWMVQVRATNGLAFAITGSGAMSPEDLRVRLSAALVAAGAPATH